MIDFGMKHNAWASPQSILPKKPNSAVGRIQYVYGRDDKDDADENTVTNYTYSYTKKKGKYQIINYKINNWIQVNK